MTAIRIIDNHVELASIGSNTHAQIDTHITANPNGTAAGQMAFWNGSAWVSIATSDVFWDNTNKRLGVGTASPAQELDLVGDFKLENTLSNGTGVIYKGTDRFIHNFQHPTGNTYVPEGRNTFVGVNAGNFTMGSTATSTVHGSYNTAIGYQALYNNTVGYYNIANGVNALYSNTTGSNNIANGMSSLHSNTTGYQNTANGYNSGRYLADGATANETSIRSLFLGYDTRANVSGGTNEIVIGALAIGAGSNSAVLGNDSITTTLLKGNVGLGGITNPTRILGVGGLVARNIGMERGTVANTAGFALTLNAGGATSAATDKAGGDLILDPGVSTGSAESGVQIRGCVAGASGTADRTLTTAMRVLGNKIGFYNVTPTTRQVLATGTSKTVDDVITALQTLGLVSQT